MVWAVLELAAQEHTKREAALARYVAHETSNRTVKGISKVLGDLFDAWAAAQQQ
jgi:acetolactate synthase small subunit